MKRILFVCLGNICRSPTAEAIMKAFIDSEGMERQFIVDSAGTSGFHEGEQADSRSRSHARERGVEIESISRKIQVPDDFKNFDYIFAMDEDNLSDLIDLDTGGEFKEKIHLITKFCSEPSFKEKGVPDPYYSGDRGFELVFDILDDACQGILDFIGSNDR